MEKKSLGFGFRGTMLIIYQMCAYATYCSFTNYPQNIMSDMYGGVQHLTLLTAIAGLILFIVQYFFVAPRVGKIKSIKNMILIFTPITIVFALGVMFIQPAMQFDPATGAPVFDAMTGMPVYGINILWDICFVMVSFLTQFYVNFGGGMLIGNWFPRRKGTVMGIVTMVFPLVVGVLLNIFAVMFFSNLAMGNPYAAAIAFAPYLIVTIVGFIICIFFVKDYPEQCGAYRDNDKSFTPEMAQKMLEAEIEAKKKSVWKRMEIWKCRDWWFMAVPAALLLSMAIAFMVQIIPVLQGFEPELAFLAIPGSFIMEQGYSSVLIFLSIAACVGSWVLGVIDTRFGTKTALIITSVLMIAAGALGGTGNVWCTIAAAILLGLFMGASSNFGLSAIVRYWRAEDFPAVYSGQPPLGFVISAIAPFIIASIAAAAGYTTAFLFVAVMGVVCVILLILFNPRNIIKMDNKLREKAGLPIDDVLEKRFLAEKRK